VASASGPAVAALPGVQHASAAATQLGVTGVHQLPDGEAIALDAASCCARGCTGASQARVCTSGRQRAFGDTAADNGTSVWWVGFLRSADSGQTVTLENATVVLPSWLTLVNTKHTAIVATRDGSLLANVYGSAPTDGHRALVGPNWPPKYRGKTLPKYRVFVIEADPTDPSTWKYLATVAFDVTNELEYAGDPSWNKTNPPPANFTKNHRPPTNAKHEGFTESYIAAVPADGGQQENRVVAVMRTGYTLYRALSVDGGHNWGNVDPISPDYGISGGAFYAVGGSQYVSPRVLTLPNGVVAVSTRARPFPVKY
jgi:hypothetical protein